MLALFGSGGKSLLYNSSPDSRISSRQANKKPLDRTITDTANGLFGMTSVNWPLRRQPASNNSNKHTTIDIKKVTAIAERRNKMAVIPKTGRLFHVVTEAELERLRKIAREVNERAGISFDPTVTTEQVQQRMLEEGVRPEDNGASRELLRMRYGDNYE